jgi:AdoMet-dependent rRNA methyltransferase SPB1
LCAAPGGWCQVALKQMPPKSTIVGIDLLPIKPIRGVQTLQEDITTQQCRNKLKKLLQKDGIANNKVDVFVHDGAPNVGGGQSWARDAFGQVELVVHSLRLVTEFVRPGGVFVTKIFRSSDYNALLWCLRQFFKYVDIVKPASSRSASAEIFAVCKGYLNPKKIDPRLLDPATVFEQIDDGSKLKDVFSKHAPKRNRQGYEDDQLESQLLFRKCSVSDFIKGDDAIAALGRFDQMVFDKKSSDDAWCGAHAETSEEIKILVDDLKVLSKRDFRTLLKWRQSLRASLDTIVEKGATGGDDEKEDSSKASKAADDVLTPEAAAEAEDAKLTAELEELRAQYTRDKKKTKRLKRKQVRKQKSRRELGGGTIVGGEDNIREDEEGPEGLFRLGDIKGKATLDAVANKGPVSDSDFSSDSYESSEPDSGMDSDQAKVYRLEKLMDYSYEEFKTRRKIVERRRKKETFTLDNEDDDAPAGVDANGDPKRDKKFDSDSDDVEDVVDDDDAGNPLLRKYNDAAEPAAAKVARWFDRDSFGGSGDAGVGVGIAGVGVGIGAASKFAALNQSSDDSDSDDADSEDNGMDIDDDASDDEKEMAAAVAASKKKQKQKQAKAKKTSAPKGAGGLASFLDKRQQGEETQKSSVGIDAAATSVAATGATKKTYGSAAADKKQSQKEKKQAKNRAKKDRKRKRDALNGDDSSDDDKAFEEVAAEEEWSEHSDNSDAVAEIQAIGTLMLRKKNKSQLLDDAYNRYTFPDRDLPDWFEADENSHNSQALPVTKTDVAMFKEKMSAIDARPIKKVAEARGRKKVRQMKRAEKMKTQANNIMNDQDSSAASKMKSIQQLYSKNKKKDKRKAPTLMVVGNTGGTLFRPTGKNKGKTGGRVQQVDSRMKNDLRAQKRSEKKKAANKSTRNKKKAKSRRG